MADRKMTFREKSASATTWQEVHDAAPPGANIAGWFTHDENWMLFNVLKDMNPGQRFVEIGCYAGAQLAMCALLNPEVEVIGIDNWSNDTSWKNNSIRLDDLCRNNLMLAGVTDRVKLITAASQVVGKTWNLDIDALITDGDHSEQAAFEDLSNFGKWVRVGGYHFVDDMNPASEVRRSYARWLSNESSAGRSWEEVVRWPDDSVNKCWLLRRTS